MQWVSKCGVGPSAAAASPGNLLEMQIREPRPRLTDWGGVSGLFNKPSRGFDAQSSVRTTASASWNLGYSKPPL